MTFTELEYLLMLTIAVLLWRMGVIKMAQMDAEITANKYARWMKAIYFGQGRIVSKDDSLHFEELTK